MFFLAFQSGVKFARIGVRVTKMQRWCSRVVFLS